MYFNSNEHDIMLCNTCIGYECEKLIQRGREGGEFNLSNVQSPSQIVIGITFPQESYIIMRKTRGNCPINLSLPFPEAFKKKKQY